MNRTCSTNLQAPFDRLPCLRDVEPSLSSLVLPCFAGSESIRRRSPVGILQKCTRTPVQTMQLFSRHPVILESRSCFGPWLTLTSTRMAENVCLTASSFEVVKVLSAWLNLGCAKALWLLSLASLFKLHLKTRQRMHTKNNKDLTNLGQSGFLGRGADHSPQHSKSLSNQKLRPL